FERRYQPKEIKWVTELAIKGIFTHYHEKLFMTYTNYNWLRSFIFQNIRLKNQGLLDAALKKGRGVILVTGHFGAVELIPLTLAMRNYPVTTIVRFKTRRLKKALLERAMPCGIRLLDAGTENVTFAALGTLKENRILLTECDEFEAWRPHKDKSTEFLGVTLPVDRTLDALQRKYQSPVIFALLKRGWNGTYVLEFHDVTESKETTCLRADLSAEAAQAGTHRQERGFSVAERALSILENYIYTYPEQWYQWKQAGLFLRPLPQGVMGETDEVKGAGHLSPSRPVFVHSQT
ncbi:MAG: lysophospholipid acyltransferase family protein, partial [Deltaproteobacteria bacterium]|nr:lysophospholipid acyltransferase family protein [Deltaproteobacteria bacterium]